MIDILQFEFMRNALLAGILAAIACGIMGAYVVSKRIVFISGGISHASFGGVGLGYLLGINPMIGAIFFSLASALGMGTVTRKTRQREDTSIGILWVMGMALGVIFIGLSSGYAPDLMSYLFGNILTVPFADLGLMVLLDVIIVAAVFLFYKEFLAVSFDEEFSEVSGIPVGKLYLLMLVLIALTVVVLIKIVGIILVIAMLALPAATANIFTHRMKRLMLLSIIIGAFYMTAGLWLSYVFNLASGATIVLFSGIVFFAVTGINGLRNRNNL